MLTRIEISGFKSFEDFSLDFGPFMVILGPNASGKSNIFDAIEAITKAATADNISRAFSSIRGALDELFTRYADGQSSTQMFFAIEVLLEPTTIGNLGEQISLDCTRLRYELSIEKQINERGERVLTVTKEEVRPIAANADTWIQELYLSSPQFKEHYLRYNRSEPLLITLPAYTDEVKTTFILCPDGRQKQEIRREQQSTEATILSSVKSSELPHLYALRQELAAYRFLQLNPKSLRKPSLATDRVMSEDGANLASALARIQAETATTAYPKGVLADIVTNLAELIPGIEDLAVELDQNNLYHIKVRSNNGSYLSCASVSDGTLRTLAVLTMIHDPAQRGLICLEEPENGINPLRLKQLIARIRKLVSNPADDYIYDQNLLQMLLSSHSPVVLSSLDIEKGEAVFTDMATLIRPSTSRVIRKTIARRAINKLPIGSDDRNKFTSKYQVNRYLVTADREVVVHE